MILKNKFLSYTRRRSIFHVDKVAFLETLGLYSITFLFIHTSNEVDSQPKD